MTDEVAIALIVTAGISIINSLSIVALSVAILRLGWRRF